MGREKGWGRWWEKGWGRWRETEGGAELVIQAMEAGEVLSLLVRSLSPV